MTTDQDKTSRAPNAHSSKIMIEEINALNQEAWVNRRNESSLTRKLSELALSLAQYAHYEQGIGEAYLNLSVYECYYGNLNTGTRLAEQTLSVFENIDYTPGLIRICNVFGYIYIVRNELGKAFEYLLRGLQLSKSSNSNEMLLFFYYNIAEIYKNTLYLYNESIQYLLEALPLIEQTPEHPLCSPIFASIGFCYQKLGITDKAMYYANRALAFAEKTSDKQTLSICHHIIANIYKEACQYERALEFAEKEMALLQSYDDTNDQSFGYANCLLTTAEIYYGLSDIDKTITRSHNGLAMVDSHGYAALAYHFYLLLAKCYEQLEDYKQSASYYKRYVKAYEKTMTVEVENRITVLSAELKQEEHLRALSLKMQNEKMAALSDIVTGVAHEINTPLGNAISIASYLDDLKKEIDEAIASNQLNMFALKDYLESTQDSINMLQQSLRRTANIVDSFKNVAMNRHALDPKTFCLCALLDDLNTLLLPELKAQQVNMEIICTPTFIITSYEELMRYILTHLIQNTLLHAFESTTSPQIRITVDKAPDGLHLSVFDNGVGITADNIGKIYNPFFTTKKANGGIGLGLNIVYNMVTQLMNGKISVRSEANTGTTFDLYFPLTTEH